MSLISSRFTSSQRLVAVSENRRVLKKGDRGRAIHLIQMALVDLGHAMPRSSGSITYSPDGIYGSETFDKVKEFQSAINISADGVVGRNTILAMDRRLQNSTRTVRLHFRSIALQNASLQETLLAAQTVYGQYGISIKFASGQSLHLTQAQQQLFNRIDGQCNWTLNSGEFNQLHGTGTPAPNNQILVYYINRFGSATLLGCGGHATARPAATVASSSSKWVTAHEVGHVLLGSGFSPVHINYQRNLMFPQDIGRSKIPVLTLSQVTRMRRSVCCTIN